MEILLEHLDLHRGGRSVLDDFCWHIRGGERWLVVGGSGAGKTQLLKVVAGDVWPDDTATPSRRYLLDGQWHLQPADVRDEIGWLGPERQDRYERYGWDHPAVEIVGTGLHRTDIPLQTLTSEETALCMRLLRRAGIAGLARRRFLTLSYGERRLVLLARVLAWRARLLLLDEVATGLDARNRARLYRLLNDRTLHGTAWICSAHRAEDIPPGATHLLWVRAGKVVYAGVAAKAKLQAALADAARSDAGRDAAEQGVLTGKGKATAETRPRSKPNSKSHARPRPTPVPKPKAARRHIAPALIRMRDANVWIDGKRVLRDIDLVIRRGECWVVHGANGSGKSTLLRTIYGDHSVASDGVIERAGMVPGVPLEVFRARTGLVAPHLQADYPRQVPVLDTVVSGLHSSIGLNFPATPAEQRRAHAALRALDMDEYAHSPLAAMSYGQVRRVLFARAQVLRPRLLLLDEAFTGLNAPVRSALLGWVDERIAAGITVVMATHYRREWPRHASHELMLSRGRIVYAGKVRR